MLGGTAAGGQDADEQGDRRAGGGPTGLRGRHDLSFADRAMREHYLMADKGTGALSTSRLGVLQ
jgi:hypothetical protein